MGHIYTADEEGLRTLQNGIILNDRSRPFRFGDVTSLRNDSYEIGTTTVRKVEGNSWIEKWLRKNEPEYRMIETDLFSQGLSTESCTLALNEIRRGDEIVYARAGNRILALLDYRDPENQKPVFVDDTRTQGKLSMQVLYNNAVFRLTTDKFIANMRFSTNFAIARFRNPTILYHNTQL